jgi:two-component system NtrC family sensor kinase|nr:histidine kinase dimerization/phospho-acceptor domain-containing protein [Alteromonas macleodii]
MASTGQLAAGIAYEINNPIGFVSANLNTLEQYATHLIAICDGVQGQLEHFTDELTEQVDALFEFNHYDLLKDDITELIAESTDGLTRVKDIVENLKNFSLETTEGVQIVDICAVCHQLITLISAQYSLQHSPRPVKIMTRIKRTKRKILKRPRKQIAQYRVSRC